MLRLLFELWSGMKFVCTHYAASAPAPAPSPPPSAVPIAVAAPTLIPSDDVAGHGIGLLWQLRQLLYRLWHNRNVFSFD